MTKGIGGWIAALAVLVVGTGVAWGLLVGKPRPAAQSPAEARPPLVDVVVVRPQTMALAVDAQGSVLPRREINLVSQVAGRIERVGPHFAQGGFFDAGEALVEVEDADYRFAIARAEAQVAAARQRVAEEKGRALQARREWRDLGSQEANALFLRKPQLASAEAALRAAEADVGAAELNLSRTRISVPFNGRVSEKHVDIGQYVAPGTVIARVYDTDAVEIRLPLTDRQVALLDLPLNFENQSDEQAARVPVRLRARFADREWEWQGRIVRTDASIDLDSRVVYAVAEVEKPFAIEPGSDRPPLSPGLFVHATIDGRAIDDVVLLPRSALRSDDSVMVVDARQQLLSRQVKVLHSNAEQVWLRGLSQRERVVVREDTLTVAGMTVAVNDVTQVTAGAR
jgi:RND family efflux transporter MFP subunit